MGMTCTICNHDKRIEIDRELVQGISHQSIADQFGVNAQAVWRHSQNHLSRQLSTAYEMKELTESSNLLARIETILSKAELIFNRNFAKEKDALALKALSESRSTLELLAKIAAHMHATKAIELQGQPMSFRVTIEDDDDLGIDRYSPRSDTRRYEDPEPEPPLPMDQDLTVDCGASSEAPSPMTRTRKPLTQSVQDIETQIIPGGGPDRRESDIARRKLVRSIS